MRYYVRVGDQTYEVAVSKDQQSFHVDLNGHRHRLEMVPDLGSTDWRIRIDGTWHRITVRRPGESLLIGIGEDRYPVQVERAFPIPLSRQTQVASAKTLEVKAPMPGLIVAVEVVSGAWVDQGRPVVIMEAMKMQMEIRTPAAGRVVAVRVHPGDEVAAAAVLVSVDPSAAK